MLFFKKMKRLTLGLTFGFIGLYTGWMVSNLNSLVPLHSLTCLSDESLCAVEERVFYRVKREEDKSQAAVDAKIKSRIRQVISRYENRLNSHNLEKVPDFIIQESKKYGYDPLFLTAVIITESSFNSHAKSRKGAMGLMQIRLNTGIALASETQIQWKGKLTLYDPRTNIALGAYYLKKLLDRFGDLNLALEAYNHGPTQLARYLRKGKLPKKYSRKVFRNYDKIKFQPV